MMKKGENNKKSTPGIELADAGSASKHSPHCTIYALGNVWGKLSYMIRYNRLKCPKTALS